MLGSLEHTDSIKVHLEQTSENCGWSLQERVEHNHLIQDFDIILSPTDSQSNLLTQNHTFRILDRLTLGHLNATIKAILEGFKWQVELWIAFVLPDIERSSIIANRISYEFAMEKDSDTSWRFQRFVWTICGQSMNKVFESV